MNLSKFLQATPNTMLFRYAPQWLSTRYLHIMGSLYYIANRKERDLIKRNISSVFNNRSDTNEIIRKTFKGVFCHYAEKLYMAYRDMKHLKKEIGDSIEYSGLEYLDDALERGGVVLVTGHFGAVEFMPLALHLRNYPVTMVVSYQSEKLKDSLTKRAAGGNVELIDGHSDNVLTQAIDALKRGRILLTECDEVDTWKTKNDRTIDAFGGKILIDRSLDVLSKRSRATVLGSFMIRTDTGYHLDIAPVGNSEKIKEEGISALILKSFEKFVMMFPDQWYQWKKFHKMRPEIA